ncbi:MAG: HAD-IIB family hydrolase [Bacillota bacterium]
MIRLLALDLDDTLLGRDGSISAENLAALEEARRRNIQITIATGRRWLSAREYVAQVKPTLPVICYCGAKVVDAAGERVRELHLLPPDLVEDLLGFLAGGSYLYGLYVDDEIYTQAWLTLPGRPEQPPPGVHVVPSVPAAYRELQVQGAVPVPQVDIFGEEAVEAVLTAFPPERQRGARFIPLRSGTLVYLKVLPEAAEKGQALARLCEQAGIAARDVVAMGDSPLDEGMLRWAGTGVAMPWASDQVKEAADLVIDQSEPHPVAAAIRLLLSHQLAGRVQGCLS